MRLKVLLPTRVLLDEQVKKVVAEATTGSFGMLPRHIDFVAPLAPGLLSFVDAAGEEQFVAVDQGMHRSARIDAAGRDGRGPREAARNHQRAVPPARRQGEAHADGTGAARITDRATVHGAGEGGL